MDNLFSEDFGIVKYVKVNREYRFTTNYGNHSDLLKEDEKASSAGFVVYNDKLMHISSESSMTLGYLGPDEEDGQNIANIVGMKLKNKQIY